ncbi:recombinase family protein [Streptomyces laurentii]|uniref:recombinase family protein n=1 Tax=Streptomyces laurentii TaxID=39478 RepID=UPI00369B8BC8
MSLWSIAKDWNARGLLSPHGKEWRSSTLRGVLLKPRNAGIQTYSQWVEKPDGRRVRLTEETAASERRTALAEMFAVGDISASTLRTGIGRCDAELTKIRAELADLAAKRVRVDLGDIEYLWEELDYEDPDRIDHVRTVVTQVCERVELMPRGRGVRAFKAEHCQITFRKP